MLHVHLPLVHGAVRPRVHLEAVGVWRHLKVANSLFRLNACELFLAGYQVEDQELCREEMQHTTMMNLMRDENPRVMCVGRVLANCWLLVPSVIINLVVSMPIKESKWDSSNARVRLGTSSSLKTLLSSPHSHVYLLLAGKGVRSSGLLVFWNISWQGWRLRNLACAGGC